MAKDLNLSSSDYSLVVLIFFVGYLLSDMIFIFLIIIFFFFSILTFLFLILSQAI